jgi:DNA polymerase I
MKTTEKFQLKTKNALFVDIETNLSHSQIWCVVTKDIEYGKVSVFFEPEGFKDHIAGYNTLIAHNGLSFDFPVLNRVWGTRIGLQNAMDTLVLSRLSNPSKEGGHSLKNWGECLNFPKDDFTGDFDAGLTDEMLTYCKRDVEVLEQVYKTVGKDLERMEFSAYSVALEHEVAAIVSRQERHGFMFDMRSGMLLSAQLSDKLRLMLDTFQTKYPPKVEKRISEKTGKPLKDKVTEFNPASRQMIAEVLQNAGVTLTKMTEKGSYIIDEDTLSSIDHPDAKLFAEYMMLQKRQSQLESWFKAIKDDGRVHGKVITNGAVTGRATHHSPNMAQIPSTASPYGAECRALWVASENQVLVGVDLSGIELRCLSHYMRDAEWQSELLDGDVHWKNAQAFGLVPMGTVRDDSIPDHKKARGHSKTLCYATLYGAGSEKLGMTIGGTAKDGARLKDNFFKNTPALAALSKKVSRFAAKGYIPALDGRKIWIRSEHAALNSLLQSAGAIIAKQWLSEFTKKLKGTPYKLVAWVHDEVVIECSPQNAEKVKQAVIESATTAGEVLNFRCPVAAEGRIGKSWYDIH